MMVWIGTVEPVAAVAKPVDPTADAGYHYVEEVRADAPIRARLALPHVTYVGSHEGCGCGYNSGDLAWQGIEAVADAMALLEAMTARARWIYAVPSAPALGSAIWSVSRSRRVRSRSTLAGQATKRRRRTAKRRSTRRG